MARLTSHVRDLVADALWQTRFTAPRHVGRLSIFTFHRVLPRDCRSDYPHTGLAVTPEELAWALDFFQQYFELRTVSEAFERFSAAERASRPWAAITFDDGQWDNYQYAAPLLEARGLRGTFFVPTANVGTSALLWHDRLGFAVMAAARAKTPLPVAPKGAATRPSSGDPDAVCQWAKGLDDDTRRRWVDDVCEAHPGAAPDWARLMSWEELRALASRGHEIGSHSVSHALLPQLNDAVLEHELAESKRVLESKLDITVSSFCYPNGSQDSRVRRAARSAGYRLALTTAWGTNSRQADPWGLRRCDMDSQHLHDSSGALSVPRLALRLSGLQPNLR